MSHADDIGNLFERFGASADSYKEIESDFEYLEPPLPVPEPSAPALPAAIAQAEVAPEPEAVAPALPEPAPLVAPEVPVAVPTLAPMPLPSADAQASLRDRLEAAARKRRAAADGLNRSALDLALHTPTFASRPRARIVAVVSAKGGVGKTTVAATLARLLARPGRRTLALDLDPQNALASQFGLNRGAPGLCQALQNNTRWDSYCHASVSGVECLPFGHASDAELRALALAQYSEANGLLARLSQLDLADDDLLVIDTASGHGPWLDPVLAIADVVVAVTLADAASWQALDDLQARLANTAECRYLVNQVNPDRALSLDMCEVLKQRLGAQLLNPVRQDYSLADALAFEHDPFQLIPQGPGCQDLRAAAHAIGQLLVKPASESHRS
ncbi:cellulose biosynthesis protein BcsQ [Pseudomonas sp. NY15354]|uniref:cellulose biosynthesis protein BcsQ n=1 Tax=Pseudomonas sp. NY15354 TaxID=3400351 RepID=UPI003A899195